MKRVRRHWLGFAFLAVAVVAGIAVVAVQSRTTAARGVGTTSQGRGAGSTSRAAVNVLERMLEGLRELFVKPTPGAGPVLKFDATQRDLGTVNMGYERTVEFRFVNDGAGPLQVFADEQGLDHCTTEIQVGGKALTSGFEIPRGKRGSVFVTLPSAGLEGDCVVKVDVTALDARSGVPAHASKETVELTIRARFVRAFEFASRWPVLTIGDTSTAHGGEGHVIVYSTDSRPFDVDLRGTRVRDVSLDATPLTPGRARWRIAAKIDRGVPSGAFVRFLRIPVVSSNPSAPKILDVTLAGFVR
jgi:hypothetical protein